MTKFNLFNGFFLLLISINLLSCQGKDGAPGPTGPIGAAGLVGPVGPAGPPGIDDPNAAVIKEGFIRGTATGNRLDGVAYSYPFDFQGELEGRYNVLSPTETVINIYKIYSGEGEVFAVAGSGIAFSIPNLSSLNSPSVSSFSLFWEKDLGSNQIFEMGKSYFPGSQGNLAIFNLTYNSSTNIITGNYTISIPENDQNGSLTIENGTFSSRIKQTIRRIDNQ